MVKERVKSVVLAVLVVISVGLSFVLWRGDWQGTSTVSLNEGVKLNPVKSPRVKDVTAPYRIAFTAAGQNSLGMPDSTVYTDWLRRLGQLIVSDWRAASGASNPASVSVAYEFGALLSTSDLRTWLPSLLGNIGDERIDRIVLYVGKGADEVTVRCEGARSFEASTNLSAASFTHDVTEVVQKSPWQPWDAVGEVYVPNAPLSVPTFRVAVSMPSTLPLVHSFFVNPTALTKAQENLSTTLWTDGSRVVWWDAENQTLTFADPNVVNTVPAQAPDLSSAVEFLRNHGGIRPTTVLTPEDSPAAVSTLEFRTYVNGLPILGDNQVYSMQLMGTHVEQFQRPLYGLGQRTMESTVRVMDYKSVLRTLESRYPKDSDGVLRRTLTVEFGYALRVNADAEVAQLWPVYTIRQGSAVVATIDAVSGRVSKGMSDE